MQKTFLHALHHFPTIIIIKILKTCVIYENVVFISSKKLMEFSVFDKVNFASLKNFLIKSRQFKYFFVSFLLSFRNIMPYVKFNYEFHSNFSLITQSITLQKNCHFPLLYHHTIRRFVASVTTELNHLTITL